MNVIPNSSESFRQDKRIYFETKIKPYQGHEKGLTRHVIDFDQDDKVDVKISNYPAISNYPENRCDYIQEPVLSESYTKLKEFARAREQEVITQEDVNLHVSEQVVETRTYAPGHDPVEMARMNNYRSISDIVQYVSPFTPNGRWAVDIKNDTFFVFEPK